MGGCWTGAAGRGGWGVTLGIGAVAAAPEFAVPLQLAYVSSRAEVGLFGPGWFCPQLESLVTPRGQGVYLWAMPGGG